MGRMTLRNILIHPDPRLKKVATPVASINADVRRLAEDMLETMYDAPGIGLAAPQIGVIKRVLTLDVSKEDEEKQPIAMINPEISELSETKAPYEEGCLSIPDYYETIERPDACKVSFLDIEGKPHTMNCTGLLATAVQHEVDHLDGKLFIDYLSRLKRERVQKKFAKMAKRAS